MAAIPAADPDVPAWLSEKCVKCINTFLDANCLKPGRETKAVLICDDLDEAKMMAHLLDCAAALGFVQLSRVDTGKSELPGATQAASNRIFTKAMTSILNEMLTYDGAVEPSPSDAMENLLRAFPDPAKLIDGRGWLSMHWSLMMEDASEADVKLIYSSDPLALQRYHEQGTDIKHPGYTPGHLLCMNEMTNRNMSLLRHFSIITQGNAFTMSANYPERGDPSVYGYTALHAACGIGKPTAELIQELLQLDSTQTKMMCNAKGSTPLGYLITNSNGTEPLIQRMMDVDSSTAVIWSAINGCPLPSAHYSRVLDRVEMLLKADPEAAKHRNLAGVNLLHLAAGRQKLPQQICIDVMRRIMASARSGLSRMASYS